MRCLLRVPAPSTCWRLWRQVLAGGLCLWGSLSFATDFSRVLMLASYHSGMPWSDAQIAGVREQLSLEDPQLDLQLDFLDTKRVQPSERYYQQFEDLLVTKYGKSPPLLILAADDDALDLALRVRKKYFPGAAILFSGVSSSRRTPLTRESAIGGVFDDLDVGDSLERLLDVLPNTRNIVVIHDQSRTSLAQVETLHNRRSTHSQIAIEYLTNTTTEAIEHRLRQLSPQDLVFALPFNRDTNGRVLTHEEAASLWAAASAAPVAVTRDVAMQPGVLGGFLVSGFEQGQTLGRLALDHLRGTATSPLPLLEGKSHATFDYAQIQRWKVDEFRLPANATVLNRPHGTWMDLRPHLPWLSVLFGSMLVIIALLLYGLRLKHRSEAALRISAKNYQELFDNCPDAIMVRDVGNGQVREINPRFQQLFGYTSEEVRNLSPAALSDDKSPYSDAEAQQWNEKAKHDGPQFFEWRSRRKDGSIFWSEISLTRFDMADGQRTVSTIRDITDRKQAEVMAKEFEHGLQQVYQNLPVAVFAINAQHQITFWNPHMTRLTGVHAEEVVGTTDTWRGVYPSARPCLVDVLVNGAKPDELDFYYPGKLRESPIIPGAIEGEDYFPHLEGGRGMWVRYCAAPLRDAQGKITGAIETLIDVTRLKRAQTTLEELNRDLEARVQARNAELKQAMGQLVQSEKLAALGSLVAGVAHELNTPIGNVLAVASTFKEDVADFSQKLLSGTARRSDVDKAATRMQEASVLIERNATKAAKLINDFKELAVDQSSTRRRHFRLLDVVNEVLTTTQPLFKNAKHEITLTIPADLAMDSYPGPLEQVLTNFLSNSLTHGFEGMAYGHITIQARHEGEEVVLEYIDDGCGIPAGNLQHIFEPFFTTKLGRGGSGLGLYIAYNLVSNVLGGNIATHSTVGTGTRFVLRLPIQAPSHSAAIR